LVATDADVAEAVDLLDGALTRVGGEEGAGVR
jgi:hypothetical protein